MPPNITTAEQAADALVAQLRLYVAGEPADVDKARSAALEAIADRVSPDAAAAVDIAVSDALSRHQAAVRIHGEPAARQMAIGPLWRCTAAVRRALHVFTKQADLDAALVELAGAEQEQVRLIAELDAAVHAGDIARVTALRQDVEITGPARTDKARLQVAGLQLAAAEEITALMTGLLEHEQESVRQATEENREARRQMDASALVLSEAHSRQDQATGARQEALREAKALRERLAALVAEQEREHAARVRRLVGVPEPVSEPQPEQAPEPQYVMTTTETTTARPAG